MGRSVHHYHIKPEGVELSLCGEKYASSHSGKYSEDPILDATCPKCSQKWGKFLLDSYGAPVQLEKVELPANSYFRSMFKVIVRGEHRGFIGNEAGWGKGWHARKLSGDIDGAPYGHEIGCLDRYQRNKTTDGSPIRPIHRASRDAMASLAVQLVDDGFLPTLEEEQASFARDKEERAKMQQRLAETRAEQQRARLSALETLASLRKRANELGLTNADLAGLADMETFL